MPAPTTRTSAARLSMLATDAQIPGALLQSWVSSIAEESFNRVTVDGDTSTNDSFVMLATGQSELSITSDTSVGAAELKAALTEMAQQLAQALIRDGEGATKFISVKIEQARDMNEAKAIAYAIAHSPLVKTAFFASDPNLGRILCAIGYAGVGDLDVETFPTLLMADAQGTRFFGPLTPQAHTLSRLLDSLQSASLQAVPHSPATRQMLQALRVAPDHWIPA